MERKNIFSLLAEKNSVKDDIERIIDFLENGAYIEAGTSEYTLSELIEEDYFLMWKGRGRCIELEDYYRTIDFAYMCASAKEGTLDDVFNIIEIVYNFSSIVDRKISKYYHLTPQAKALRKLMDDVLSDYNQKAFYDEEQELVFVVEDKPEVTAVAEIVEVDLAANIIKYNHRTLKGNISAKKTILLAMGAELEPKRRHIPNDLADKIFFMLNNMNLRHNNINEKDKNYREYVAKMPEEEMEEWYDELYQMMLLAFLEIDQQDRNGKIEELKGKIIAIA